MVRTFVGITRAALWLSVATISYAPAALAQQVPPDNTQVNQRDRAASQVTADQQKNNRSDVAITRDIRRALVNDKKLSTYAHNIKVITRHGDVTLKGPVPTEDEKKVVEARATDVAGAGHVSNEISVTSTPAGHPAKSKS
jgi:hyperosmotically inducible protein